MSMYTQDDVKNKPWVTLGDGVYDVSEFMESHPGGSAVIQEHLGRDVSEAFADVGDFSD
jgi:cytochrome b involved in lipid metabolism